MKQFRLAYCFMPFVLGASCSRADTESGRSKNPSLGTSAMRGPKSSESKPAIASTGFPLTPHSTTPAEEVLRAWNSALNNRNIARLASFYAPSVRYYGVWRSALEVVEATKSVLAKNPDYRHRLGHFRVSGDSRRTTLIFEQFCGPDASVNVATNLVVEEVEDNWVIVEESDTETEERSKRGCAGMALYVANHHPSIVHHYRRLLRDYPHLKPGDFVHAEDNRNMEGAIGLIRPGRFETHFRVGVRAGQLEVHNAEPHDAMSSKPLKFNEEDLGKVRLACDDKHNPNAPPP